ncbi:MULTISPECIES: transposase [unclassified Streptomyces]|uniref:transposase n=1 Tax=unclassified Streptomyces TaxID=2593676 RepID=UPI0013DC1DA7|nr:MULTISPECIES: transposase [unclassified Streptomyces]
MLAALGVVLAARAVARLAQLLGVVISRMTVLRLVMALPDRAWAAPRVLGIDEFATRRGRRYGTILVDCETHQPLDLLPDRNVDSVAAWLREHPSVEIVCRDRATVFVDGAREGAPNAQHCADKWHVWHNLGEAVERLVSHHRPLLRGLVAPQSPEPEPEPEPSEPAPAAAETATADAPEPYPAGKFLDRLRDTHAAVRAQVEQGLSLREIARRLGLGRNTVRKYARSATPEAMLHGQWQNRTSKLDPFRPYIEQRITEGCTNLSRLHGELHERGARCSYSTLRDYVHPLRPGRRPGAHHTADGPPCFAPPSHPLDHGSPRPSARGRPAAAQDTALALTRAHGSRRPRPRLRDHHDQPRRRQVATLRSPMSARTKWLAWLATPPGCFPTSTPSSTA